MADDSHWIERAHTAEAKLKTMKEAQGAAIERIQAFKANFGIRERDNGTIVIDFDKFVLHLGEEQALELKHMIDLHYGNHGKKV